MRATAETDRKWFYQLEILRNRYFYLDSLDRISRCPKGTQIEPCTWILDRWRGSSTRVEAKKLWNTIKPHISCKYIAHTVQNFWTCPNPTTCCWVWSRRTRSNFQKISKINEFLEITLCFWIDLLSKSYLSIQWYWGFQWFLGEIIRVLRGCIHQLVVGFGQVQTFWTFTKHAVL